LNKAARKKTNSLRIKPGRKKRPARRWKNENEREKGDKNRETKSGDAQVKWESDQKKA